MKDVRAIVTGIGETPVGSLPGSTALSLMQDAAALAIADAGLTPKQIDGIVTGRSMVRPLHRVAVILAERLGLRPTHFATLEAGGATSVQLLIEATMAIQAGLARHVLCVAADNLRTGLTKDGAVQTMAENAHPEFEVPFGTFPPAAYALVANAHMAAYGTTREQLAEVAVSARNWAQFNPAAELVSKLTISDVLAAKPISSPFTAADCALVSDGGGAFIVSHPDAAKDTRRKPVRVLGFGQCATHEYITCMPSLTTSGAVESGARAFAMAGVTPKDIQLAEIYDCFTITPIVVIEDLGFCQKGEGGPFLSGGRTMPDGALPMNTHGGLLSHAHPGKPGGIFHLTEAVRQLRGGAGARQVKSASLGLVHGVGGMFSAHATAIFST